MSPQAIKFSIRWKLLILMITLLISIQSISTYFQINNQKKVVEQELQLRIQLLIEQLRLKGKINSVNLARQVEYGLATANLSQLSEILNKSVNEDEELAYAVLLDTTNRVYIHTLRPEYELEIIHNTEPLNTYQYYQNVVEHQKYGFQALEFISQIQISTQPWGELHLGFSKEKLNERILELRRQNQKNINLMISRSLIHLLIFILVSSVIILVLSDRLSRPIRRLTKAINKLAQGDFSNAEKIEIDSSDEIGVLSHSFVDMSNQLKAAYLNLEQKVEERTFELAQARDDAIQANQSKSNFLSMISHEIRTPMYAIIGMGQLSLKSQSRQKQTAYLKKINTTANSLLLIINDLLDISKIEAGQITIEVIDFKIHDVIDHVRNLMEIKARDKTLGLNFYIASDVPETLRGDPLRIGQVLLNLVNNAIKFTEVGEVNIRVYQQLQLQNRHDEFIFSFSVEDSGIGLAKDEIDQLFKPFSQANDQTSRLYGGTGLGLFISKHLVELMGGIIEIKSDEDQGSLFTFSIPLEPAIHAENIENKTETSESEKSFQLLKGRKVLVVDDYSINREIVKSLLEAEGLQVFLAESGLKALSMLDENVIDFVLLDLQMPEMDGYETARRIKQQEKFLNLPVIALSAFIDQEKNKRCLEAGMSATLNKSFNLHEMLEVLVKTINLDRPGSEFKPNPSNIGNHKRLIQSLDIGGALHKLSNNQELYKKLLSEFKAQFFDVIPRTLKCIDEGNTSKARKLIHGLKGVALNLSAVELSQIAEKLESALDTESEEIGTLVQECQTILSKLLSDIESIQHEGKYTQTSQESHQLDYEYAGKLLFNVIELLKQYYLDADTQFEAFKSCFPAGTFTEELAGLEQSIGVFDYKNALFNALKIKNKFPVWNQGYVNSMIFDKPRILIVDDIPLNIKFIALNLRKKYTLQIVNNGRDAFNIAASLPKTDLIILDVEMPGINGYEVCLKLKENELTQHIPVIFLTSRTKPEDEQMGLEMGAVDYICKPVTPSVLMARVNAHIALGQQRNLLEKFATIDLLTHIPNERKFHEVFEHEWLRARRSQKALSILVINLDYFNMFNDFFGHPVGDQCLIIIAKALTACLKRRSDFISRGKTVEFVVLLPETDHKAAYQLAEFMRLTIENLKLPHVPVDGVDHVTASFGVSTVLPQPGIAMHNLLQAAHDVLAHAKESGKNRVDSIML